MKNVILSDDKIPVSLLVNDTVTADDINDLCIEQARHLLKVLKYRYTRGIRDDLGRGWIMISPDELAEIEKEIEG